MSSPKRASSPSTRRPRRVLVSVDREVAVRLAGAGDRVAPDRVGRRAGSRSRRARGRPRRASVSRTPTRIRFCWRAMRMSAPACSAEIGDRDQLVAGDQAEANGNAHRAEARLACGWMPRWFPCRVAAARASSSRSCGRVVLSTSARMPSAPMSSTMNFSRAFTRETRYLQILAPCVEDRGEHLDGLVLRDEDAEVAREARHRREAAADEHAEALAALVDHADEGDTVDLRRVAAVGAGGDRVLVLARQVRVVRVAVEELGRRCRARRGVEELVVREACNGQPVMLRTVSPHPPAVVMPARSRSAKTFGERAELEPVELDVLPRRQLGVAAAVAVRDLADCAKLRRERIAARELDRAA